MNTQLQLQIQEKIEQITETLLQTLDDIPGAGLYGGKSGVGIYFSYLNKVQPDDRYNAIINQLISDSFESINEDVSSPSYSFGITGILWTLHHLKVEGLIDADDYFEELIPFIGEQMLAYANNSNFDYLHGAVGIGFYLLHFENEVTDMYLHKLVQLLMEKGISEPHTIKWESNFNAENQKNFNLSLSHGISSMIIFFSKLIKRNPSYSHEVKDLLKKSLNYLLSQKNDRNGKFVSLYPNEGELKRGPQNSRLSWCYGDLGIAASFWQAGQLLREEKWKEEALHIMHHASKRKDLKLNQVADAGVCHGTAGIAHLFNRFYWETKDQVFKDTADYWIKETLKMARFEDGLAGYKAWQGEKGWMNQHGILEGIAGIGLVLLSYLSNEEPSWDRSFLLS